MPGSASGVALQRGPSVATRQRESGASDVRERRGWRGPVRHLNCWWSQTPQRWPRRKSAAANPPPAAEEAVEPPPPEVDPLPGGAGNPDAVAGGVVGSSSPPPPAEAIPKPPGRSCRSICDSAAKSPGSTSTMSRPWISPLASPRKTVCRDVSRRHAPRSGTIIQGGKHDDREGCETLRAQRDQRVHAGGKIREGKDPQFVDRCLSENLVILQQEDRQAVNADGLPRPGMHPPHPPAQSTVGTQADSVLRIRDLRTAFVRVAVCPPTAGSATLDLRAMHRQSGGGIDGMVGSHQATEYAEVAGGHGHAVDVQCGSGLRERRLSDRRRWCPLRIDPSWVPPGLAGRTP